MFLNKALVLFPGKGRQARGGVEASEPGGRSLAHCSLQPLPPSSTHPFPSSSSFASEGDIETYTFF